MGAEVYDPAEWTRVGRGLELQFYATDLEVREWFAALPEDYGPYTVWAAPLAQKGNRYEREVVRRDLVDWLRVLSDAEVEEPLPVNQFFLVAERLVSWPALAHAGSVNEWAAVNGLVLVQHGASRSGKRLASRIAVVDKIRNRSTGEVMHLEDRMAVFRALERMIRPQLCFATIQVFKDGREEEDRVQLMTAAAAELGRGFFARSPGGKREH